VTDLETRALRDPRLRRHHAVVVFLCVAPSLTETEVRSVKVRRTAAYLRVTPITVRLALALLVRLKYLVRVPRRNNGTAGEYRLPTGSPCDPVQLSAV
jgi:hypothetical protein